MTALKVAQPPRMGNPQDGPWQDWFNQIRENANAPKYFTKSSNPSLTEIPPGTFSVWKNTTTNVVRLWANNNGVLVGITLT